MVRTCLPNKKLAHHLSMLSHISALGILFASRRQGIASNILTYISNATRSVGSGGWEEFMLPNIFFTDRSVMGIFLGCSDLKPCCDGSRGICRFMSIRTAFGNFL